MGKQITGKMEDKNQIENTYHSMCHDAIAWIDQSDRHIIASQVIYREWEKLFKKHPDLPIEQDQNIIALLDSYMLLLGLGMENIIKALIISIKPDFDSIKELDLYKWSANGGHGIKEMFLFNIPNLNHEEIDLLDRLQEFIVWAGKYNVPNKSTNYIASKTPLNTQRYKPIDNQTAKKLIQKVKTITIDNWESNKTFYWKWKENSEKNKKACP